MRRIILFFMVFVVSSYGIDINYEDLKGAKRKTEFWDIGFGIVSFSKLKPYLSEIEGIAYFRKGKWNVEKLPMPYLNITWDVWVYKKVKNEEGKEVMGRVNSKVLDKNNDGYFFLPPSKNETAIIPATYFDIPVKVGKRRNNYLSFTYISEKGEKNAKIPLNLKYLNKKKTCRIGFFNPAPRASWWTAKGVYIIQSTKDRGIIIGRIGDGKEEDKISIIPGTLKITSGKEFKPSKTDKLIWPGHIYGTATDFDAYEMSRLGNVVPLFPAGFEWVPVSLWDKYPEATRKMKEKAENAQRGIDNLHKYGVDVILGLNCETTRPYPEMLKNEFPEYIPEKLTPDGKFIKCAWLGGLDEANPEAMEFLEKEFSKLLKRLFRDVDYIDCEPEARFFTPYKYMRYPFYSKAALENYRKFLNDPKARFPTASSVPETERTNNRPSATDWKNYFKWRTKVHTDFFIRWAKAGYLAFHNNPRYKGAEAEDGAGIARKNVPHGVDLERMFSCPYISFFVAEYPKSASDPYFIIWHKYARKYNKKLINLFDVQQLFTDIWIKYRNTPELTKHIRNNMKKIKKTLIKFFISAGVDIDTDGYGCCSMSFFNHFTYPSYAKRLGGTIKNEIWPLWQALIRKYYGYGYMSLKEAEEIIREAEKEKIPFNPAGKKKLKILFGKEIIIDGKDSDWIFPETQFIGNKKQAHLHPREWKGKKDLSCYFSLATDRKNLYIAAKVRDDKFFPESKLTLGQYGDEVNLYISFADPRKEILVIKMNCWQLRLLPERKQVYIAEMEIPGSKAICRRLKDGYFIEGSIPFSYFKFYPRKGDMVRVDFSVLDADSEKGAKSNLIWNADYKPWRSPEGWGIGIFTK